MRLVLHVCMALLAMCLFASAKQYNEWGLGKGKGGGHAEGHGKEYRKRGKGYGKKRRGKGRRRRRRRRRRYCPGKGKGYGKGYHEPEHPLERVRSIDGTDLEDPTRGGKADTPLIRTTWADYSDGTGENMTEYPASMNPRTISNDVVNQGNAEVFNSNKLSDMFWQWGQLLDHDLSLTGNGPENGMADITIDDVNDPFYCNGKTIPFARSVYEGKPRQQMNEITSFIDASNVYGSDDERANALRTFVDGKLKSNVTNFGVELLPFNFFDMGGGEGLVPSFGYPTGSEIGMAFGLAEGGSNLVGFDEEEPDRNNPNLYLAGDVRATEQIGLTSIHTLFVREHNRLAHLIKMHYPDKTDEEIYQMARKIVGAEMQIITYNEFLPILLGPMAPSSKSCGYDPDVDPSIANEFSTTAYRFGHTMISENLNLLYTDGRSGEIPLLETFFKPYIIMDDPLIVDALINGLMNHQAQEIDHMIVDALRNFLFGGPCRGGLDLASLNLQRARDHGIPRYNELREAYGLKPATTWSDISSDPEVQSRLKSVYETPDDVDPWLGGLAEDHVYGAAVGELIGRVIREQFIRLRDGDPFYYRHDKSLKHPKIRKIIDLRWLRLSDIIRWNTDIEDVPGDVFHVW